MDPKALNVVGATQPDIYRGTVEDMVLAIRSDPDGFWRESFRTDGHVRVWVIGGERFLSNGNHRYQAALTAGSDIPEEMIEVQDAAGSGALTFRFDQMTWLPGRK